MLKQLDLTGIPKEELPSLLPRPSTDAANPNEVVMDIITSVRSDGDAALRKFGKKFDGGAPESFLVSESEIDEAWESSSNDLKEALIIAEARIREFHITQMRTPERFLDDGITVETIHQPVSRAGCYVPGGRAAYPSTLLMTATPAKVAGVEDVVVCVPPDSNGNVNTATLAAARIAGVTSVFAVGGAQAIAAMAYGTETVEPVDVIVGPGNIYVATAKRLVAGDVGIAAAFAGPSEIVVIADESASARFAAIDLIVQAEHGPDGLSWLISWDRETIDVILSELQTMVLSSDRAEMITKTFASGGYAVLVDGPKQAMEVANLVAPEHLQLMVTDPQELLPSLQNAGAVFLGGMSPASVGDYIAGPSHVLPTHGSARFSGALTVDDFCKDIHVISLDKPALENIAETVISIANAEGLSGHADSIRIRLEEE
ncbi:MAG: histidinol dehydrogenase [Acidimicrobiales bacterium]|jgi:histidinol dehydrogenase|nr:histidinol dehydrogenase [Acidimicrobiales bacterium]